MRLAVHLADFSLPGAPSSLAAPVAATARAADQGGCSSPTLMDHYFQMESVGVASDPMLEGYTTLGVDQVRVGPSVPDPVRWVEELCERVLPDLRRSER